MSIELMTAVWKAGPDNITQRFVLLALADHANDHGYCWPSYEHVAMKCCLSRRTVIRVVKELEEAGWLTRQRRAESGKDMTNGFWLSKQRLGVTQDHPRGDTRSLRGDTRTPLGVTHDHPGGDTRSPVGVTHDHPNLHSESSMNRQDGTVNEVVGDHIDAGRRILTRWQQLIGRTPPRDDDEWAREWFVPVNQLWVRVGRDEDAAFEAMAAVRQRMLAEGKTPFRPRSVVPYALAELDKGAVVENGRPQTVEDWTSYFAEA
jgi:hypothetical protein